MKSSHTDENGCSLREFLLRLPKADLHLHLEGSVEPETLLEIHPDLDPSEINSRFQYTGFAGFLKAYVWVAQKLNSPEAYRLAARRLLQKLDSQNIQFVEITLSVGVIFWKGEQFAPIFDALCEECKRHPAIQVRWIFDAIRQFGVEPAARVFDCAKEYRGAGVVAVGIGGDEERGPASWFQDLYREAKTAGLNLTCHAGEVAGPESVWQAIQIGTQRIGHGIRSIEDSELLNYLRLNDIPLEVCPSSNVQTGAVTGLKDHPLRRLFDAGVPLVIGTDDPALFHTDLLQEYTLISEVLRFPRAELRQLAENSLKYRFSA